MSHENPEDILITEQCGSLGTPEIYSRQGQSKIGHSKAVQKTLATSLVDTLLGFLREVLLPYGYPDSVSSDYLEYQIWDTVQAFCSTITGIFTTQAILKGMGVGDAEASALSATITWVMKDGTGMVGRIIFAWLKGNGLDCDCKKWRLFADLLNDCAMVLELIIPSFQHRSVQILCVSTAMKSVVGVAGGATRASITNHQAIKGNMADVSAKDGSQETVVNLVATFTGIFLINYFTDSNSQWVATFFLIFLHLYSNYRAVTCLVFKNLNNIRMNLVLKSYLNLNIVLKPETINQKEPVFLGLGATAASFCGFRIVLGESLRKPLSHYNPDELKSLTQVYEKKKYMLVPDLKSRIIYVAFEKNENAVDVITAYYHAVLLAVATCVYNDINLDIYTKRQLHNSTPITRLNTSMKTFPHNGDTRNPINIPPPILMNIDSFFDVEAEMFLLALGINGWKVDSHSLYLTEWRIQWKYLDRKIQ